MTTSQKLLTLILASLLLSGCLTDAVSPFSGLPVPPPDMMQPRQTSDMLQKMDMTIKDAPGVKADWLYDYAGEAQVYGLRLDACQAFVLALPVGK